MRKELSKLALVATAWAMTAVLASAQFVQQPGLNNPVRPGFGAPAAALDNVAATRDARVSSNVRAGYNNVGYGGVGYSPWGPFMVQNPYGAAMSGLADLTQAQGQYLNDWQHSRIINQQVEQQKIQTRYQMMQLRQYERSLQPSLEELREQERQRELRRALNDPPFTEILSGGALNNLLKDIQRMSSMGVNGPSVPVDPDVLKHINLTSSTGGNIGAFKNGGKIRWPLSLTTSLFERSRTNIERLIQQVIKEAESPGGVQSASVRELSDAVKGLESSIDTQSSSMGLQDLIQAKRTVRELSDAVTAIQNPDSSNYLNNKWAAQGQTVGDMVNFMTKQGLLFAAAVSGDETYYRVLHQAMVTYTLGAKQASAQR